MIDFYMIVLCLLSALLAFNSVIMFEKNKKILNYLYVILLLLPIAFIMLKVYEQELDIYKYYGIIGISYLLFFILIFIIRLYLYNKSIIDTFKQELSNKYTDFIAEKISKKEVVSENKIGLGAIRHCYDFHIYIKKYDCDLTIYRVQELSSERYHDVDYGHSYAYLYKTIYNVIQYKYNIPNYVNIDAVKTNLELFSNDENIEVILVENKLIINIKINTNKYEKDNIYKDVENVKNYYERIIG